MSEPGYNFTNFQEDAAHPFTGRTDAQGNFTGYNPVGLALLTGGTGLITWVLSRMLGMKSGASLTASILGSLAMAHIATGKQRYGDAFDPMKVDQWKEMFNNAKGKLIDPQAEEDAKMRAEQDAMNAAYNKANAQTIKEQQEYAQNKEKMRAAYEKYKDTIVNTDDYHLKKLMTNKDPEKQWAAMYEMHRRLEERKPQREALDKKRQNISNKIKEVRFPLEHQANAAEDEKVYNQVAEEEAEAAKQMENLKQIQQNINTTRNNFTTKGNTTIAENAATLDAEARRDPNSNTLTDNASAIVAMSKNKQQNDALRQAAQKPVATTTQPPAPQTKPKAGPPAGPTSVPVTNAKPPTKPATPVVTTPKPQAVSGPQAAHNAFIDKNFPGARQNPELWKSVNEAIDLVHPSLSTENPFITPGGTVIY